MNTTIRNIDDWILNEINQQAAASGRSQQGYLKHILGVIAATPLPINRDSLFNLLKLMPSRESQLEATHVHVTRLGEFWSSVVKLARNGPDDQLDEYHIAGMTWRIVGSLPLGVHARFLALDADGEELDRIDITTKHIWDAAGKVDRTIQLR